MLTYINAYYCDHHASLECEVSGHYNGRDWSDVEVVLVESVTLGELTLVMDNGSPCVARHWKDIAVDAMDDAGNQRIVRDALELERREMLAASRVA